MARIRGKVKWFNNDKGFGFLTREDNGRDCFVHFSSVETSGGGRVTLAENDRVEFDVVEAPKGPKAENVRRLEGR